MRTSIIGYPRVGTLRVLKFATEKYFNKEISSIELQNVAKKIRMNQWLVQKNSGLNFIPSNDFSFYDNMLDTAVLFNIIPNRYSSLGLNSLDTYFAMARGYQGEAGDVRFSYIHFQLKSPLQSFRLLYDQQPLREYLLPNIGLTPQLACVFFYILQHQENEPRLSPHLQCDDSTCPDIQVQHYLPLQCYKASF